MGGGLLHASRCLARGRQYPSAGFDRDGTFAERVDEGSRRQDASLRMPPAKQGLGADHSAVAAAHLRLEMQNELLVHEGAPKLGVELAAIFRPRAQGRRVQPE
jgi:hypothetical protein